MSRPAHRHRHVRLTTGRERLAANRIANRPRKDSERARRDVRMIASLKAAKTDDYNPAIKSWVAAKVGKAWRQVTKDDIKALIA